jgi:hypothetical protein
MYYPLSQITTNLYTNGNEFTYINSSQIYAGYYWRTSSGKIYSGKNPQDTNIQELTPIIELSSNSIPQGKSFPIVINQEDVRTADYISISKTNVVTETFLPYYLPTLPTDKDYQVGEFRRYFCKKTNEIIYIEIDKNQFDLLRGKDVKIAFEYYQPFFIPWALIGDETYVANVNFNMVQLTIKNQKLPMFDKYIKEDYVKYYKYTA